MTKLSLSDSSAGCWKKIGLRQRYSTKGYTVLSIFVCKVVSDYKYKIYFVLLTRHFCCLVCFRKLPNGLARQRKEVCLFVKDLDRTDREYEKSVQHFKTLLKSKGISCVSEVCLPWTAFSYVCHLNFKVKKNNNNGIYFALILNLIHMKQFKALNCNYSFRRWHWTVLFCFYTIKPITCDAY